ncbi:MAG: hypothetical protein OER86_09050, partial [Phycisphaerae bacterium]|nr:hypothetical protein [Phycisphaerae bacterium]
MNKNTRNRGVAAILAMMFLVIFGSLTAAMAIVAQGNIRTATTYQRVNRSMATAETGVRFFNYRLSQIAATVTTDKGVIDEGLADQLWPLLRDEIINQMGNELHSLEPYYLEHDNKLILGRVPVDNTADAPTFKVILERHPIAGENYDAAMYQQAPYNVGGGENDFTADGEPVSSVNPVSSVHIRVKSVGEDEDYVRSVQMDFRMDKKIRFAIVSRNRVMIGKNVLIKGTVASAFTRTDLEHGHPVQMRDNFHGLDTTLDTWLDSLEVYLSANDADGDNRVKLSNDQESENLENPESWDRNGDGFVDAYDMFLLKYDITGPGDAPDGIVSTDEFSASGELIDAQLWQVINEFKYPAGTKFDWDNLMVQLPDIAGWADASQDLGKIDEADDYAKIQGAIVISADKAGWETGAAEGAYQEFLAGPISSDPDEVPMTFEADLSTQADLEASDFDVSSYKLMATGGFAAQVAAALPHDTAQPAVFTPPSIGTIESVPFNSPHPYDYYLRP